VAVKAPPRAPLLYSPVVDAPLRRVWPVVLAVQLGVLLAALDATIVGTAMPTIIATLGGVALYPWVFSAYMLAATAVMPVFGGLSDRLGRKGPFLTGVGVFCAGSLVAGVAPSMGPLIVGRVLQGIGAGGILSLSLVIFGDLFPGPQRGRMQSLITLVWGIASIAGPLLGGVIVDHWGWRWVFTMNLPLGAVVVALVWGGLRETAPAALRGGAHRLDLAGTALFLVGTSAVLLACLEPGPARFGAAVAGVVCLAVFLRVERTAPAPLLAPSLFRERPFVAACVAGFFAGFAMFGALVHVPLLVQWGHGTDATTAGLSLMTMSLGWSGGGLVAGNLVNLMGVWWLSVLGMAAMAAGYAGLAARPDAGFTALRLAGAGVGVGMGLVAITLIIAVQALIRREDRGIATAAVLFFRSVGGTVGVAVMGAVLTARVGLEAGGLAEGQVHLPPALAAALVAEMGLVFWVGTAAAVLGLGATLFLPRATPVSVEKSSRA
jgi:EmrB/QacA subfamily drug resistance transporter